MFALHAMLCTPPHPTRPPPPLPQWNVSPVFYRAEVVRIDRLHASLLWLFIIFTVVLYVAFSIMGTSKTVLRREFGVSVIRSRRSI